MQKRNKVKKILLLFSLGAFNGQKELRLESNGLDKYYWQLGKFWFELGQKDLHGGQVGLLALGPGWLFVDLESGEEEPMLMTRKKE